MAKKAIVFIHGFNHDHRCWEPVMQYLHEDYPTVLTRAVYDTLNLPKKASEFPEKSKGNSLNKAGHMDSPLHYIYPLSENHQR